MQRLKLTGDVEAKFKQVEIILQRIVRRVNTNAAVAYLTNFGMHGYVAQSGEDGVVLRDMIPIGGRLSYVYLFVESIVNPPGDKDKRAELVVAIERKDSVGLSKGILIKEGMQETPVSLEVMGGSRLVVKSSKILEGVWYGLVIDPTPQSVKVEYPETPMVEAVS